VSYLVAFDLVDDLRRMGCPMCRAMCRVGEEHLRSLMAADISDSHVRNRMKRSGGLCREHVLTAVEIAARSDNRMGMALVAEFLLEIGASRLNSRQTGFPPRPNRRWRHRQRTRDSDSCPACAAESVIVDSYIESLLTSRGAELRKSILDGERGFCLPHALRAIDRTDRAEDRALIVESWNRRAQHLTDLLAEFFRKESYQNRLEPKGAEADAWVQASEWVVGVTRHRFAGRWR
jgi:hypothetical protein